eukprot:scaffold176419_cov18-Tisochrysis_lutea.AAC.2
MSRQDHTPSTAAGAATAAANQEQQLLHLGDEQSDILGCRDQSTVQPPRFGVEDCVDAVVVRVMGAGQSAEERLSKNRPFLIWLLLRFIRVGRRKGPAQINENHVQIEAAFWWKVAPPRWGGSQPSKSLQFPPPFS